MADRNRIASRSAILASLLLNEKLGRLGICGCACCLVSDPSHRLGTLRKTGDEGKTQIRACNRPLLDGGTPSPRIARPSVPLEIPTGSPFANARTFQIGSVIIILHAPADRDVQTVDEILEYAMQPGRRAIPLVDTALLIP